MDAQVLRICEVIDTNDPEGMDRIKVRMAPEDNHKPNNSELPYVFPLLPKNIFIKPKVGECVIVMTVRINDGNSPRFYIGPVIPQINKMSGNDFNTEAATIFDSSRISPNKSPYTDPMAEGSFPESDDVSIVGKKNTDIQLKDNDLRIRCGVKTTGNDTESGVAFNKKDPAYIKMKYNPGEGDGKRSNINIVADKINLIGNQSNEHFDTTDKSDLFTDEELDRFLKEAHTLPYGDILVDFLKKLRDAFLCHTHPFSMMPPSLDIKATEVAKYDLDKILSDSIRIN